LFSSHANDGIENDNIAKNINLSTNASLLHNAPSRGFYERFSASKIPTDLAC
jgi:hypothetical protein